MREKLMGLALLLWLSVSLHGQSNAITPPELDFAPVEFFIEEALRMGAAPGLAVAVVQGERLVYQGGFGYADLEQQRAVTPETAFYIASTTKSFTAFLLALLHHRGLLDLDVPIRNYIPELRLRPPLSPDSITVRQLLTHTHGIEQEGPIEFRTAFTGEYTEELIISLLESYAPAEKGKQFQYGNLGYILAGIIVDRVTTRSWRDMLQEEIFRPLSMEHTSAFVSRIPAELRAMPYLVDSIGFRRLPYMKGDETMHAAGGMISTAKDLAKWVQMHLNQGRWNGKQIFPGELVQRVHQKQVVQYREFGPFQRFGWSLGWDLGIYEGDTLIHRFGSFPGFRSHVSFMPAHHIGVVVLVNEGTLGSLLADGVATLFYDVCSGKPDITDRAEKQLALLKQQSRKIREQIRQDYARRSARPRILLLPLQEYAGTYVNEEMGTMVWQVVEGKLQVQMGRLRSSVEVYEAHSHKLRVELTGYGEVVSFQVENEKITGLVYRKKFFRRVRP